MAKNEQLPPDANNAQIARSLNMVNNTLIAYGKDIGMLVKWKQGIEIADRAVDNYKRKEREELAAKLSEKTAKTKLDLLKDLAPLIAAGVVLLYAIANHYGAMNK